LFPQDAQWKIHPTLKIPPSVGTTLFSLDPKANAFLAMHAHGGGDLVDLKNAMVVPFELVFLLMPLQSY